MSFSFRNLFSQEAPDETLDARSDRSGAGNLPEEISAAGNWPGFSGGAGRQGPRDGSEEGAVFRPNPQPTNRGDFTALFGNALPPAGAESQPGVEQVFRAGDILPFIPPALAARGNFSADERVQIRLPANGSREVRLSQIYQACPRLFSTPITVLNDSVVALSHRQAPANGGGPLSPARDTGGLPGPRSGDFHEQESGDNPFWMPPASPAPAARPVAAEVVGERYFQPAQQAADRNETADATGFSGFNFPGAESPAGSPGKPGGFFGPAPEPAPGAEHLGQYAGNGAGGAVGFGFPDGGPRQAGSNPFGGESFSAGRGEMAAANPGFGAPGGGADQRPQNVANAAGPPENNYFSSMPPAGGGGAFGAPQPDNAAKPAASGFWGEPPNPFAQSGNPPAAGAGPESAGGRTVDLRLRDLFSRQPVQMTGIDPMGIPQDAMVRIPLARIESQMSSGSLSLKLSELAALAEPVAAAVLMRGNPQALIALPENEVARQAGDAKPAPAGFPFGAGAGAPEAQPQPRAEENPFAGGFDTLFSQKAKSDAIQPSWDAPAPGGDQDAAWAAADNPFLQSLERQSAYSQPATFQGESNSGGNPFAGQAAGPPAGPAKPGGEDSSTFLPPRAASAPAEPAADQGGPPFSLPADGFLDELEKEPKAAAPPPEASRPPRMPEMPPAREPAPEPAAPKPAEPERAAPQPEFMPGQPAVRDIELRAVFGTSEAFTLQRVADLTIELAGVASCFVSSPHGSAQSPKPAAGDQRAQADSILRGVRELARITGVENAETFTVHTDHGVVSVFVHGEACLTVRHQRGEFDPGVREKLILVVRGASQLSG